MTKSSTSDYQMNHDRYRPSIWKPFSTYKPIDPFAPNLYTYNNLEFLYTPASELIDQFMNESIEMFHSRLGYKGDITFCLISFSESIGEGANWSNITDYTIVPDINLLMILGAMIFSLVLYIFIIWYFDAVWPWQPGVPKPFYFMFTKSYWCGTKPNEMDETNLVKNETSSDYFEEEPTRSLAGVVIKNLSKEFRTGMTSKLAVNDVSLNIYQGQITALLGHNGAGKTTTINILTGLYTPTSGTAMINGYDILTEITKARRGFGVCPQHNVLYDTLTVEEHLKIYAAMKGVPWNQLTSEASKVLDILKLSDKSLGIAVVGGSKVLFLDEPTSGLDVEARRSVWDALLEIRHDCTIILTTHYMEEADILGDRIAIMAEGEVQCCGSPLFLKQKFGTGYHLHVVKDQKFHLDGLTSLLRKYVPEVTLGNELEKEISFNLASDTNSSFGDMFEELENQKRNLGVTSFGITVTTMEDVFLRVSTISDMKYKIPSDSDNKNGYSIQYEDVYGDSPGLNSYPKLHNQFWALIVKRFRYSKRHWSILISQFVIPFVLIAFTLAETVSHIFKSNKIHSERVQNPSHYVLDYGKTDISKYLKNLIVGGAIDKYPNGTYNLTAWYNGEPYHSTPLSLLLMHTALLQNVTNTGSSISLTNAPIPVMDRYMYDMSSTVAKLLGPVFVPLALGFLSASFILLPIHERASKAKLLQLMSGVPPIVYWAAMFLWDYAIYCIVSILLIIPYAMFAHYAFFGAHSEAIGTALLLMFLYGLSAIPFSYLVSFLFKKGNTGYSFVLGFCSIIGVGLCTILKAFQNDIMVRDKINKALWAFRIFPTFSLASGFSNLYGTAF
ncbi:ATP-binding cassette sub-family A member 17 [Caerostris extrusa]|uniref:ATP-binding cassette sub-family A member 17 n=1 Tax=Caerostris extrusa TaxID=172846 RepID=A0AAV4QAY6_CAEEX|nr:ATP-binding cassette sub-family A member 17 [Caerostris extrusa]